MVVESQSTDKDTGLIIDVKKHLHAYVHCAGGQEKNYLRDELKKLMDKHGHNKCDDGTLTKNNGRGGPGLDVVHCYEWKDYLNKYDKTKVILDDGFDIESFKRDFPTEAQQQELQKGRKNGQNDSSASNMFANLEQDIRAKHGTDLCARNIGTYVKWRINVKRDLPPMRDERTEREFIKKLFRYIHGIIVAPAYEKLYDELDEEVTQRPRALSRRARAGVLCLVRAKAHLAHKRCLFKMRNSRQFCSGVGVE